MQDNTETTETRRYVKEKCSGILTCYKEQCPAARYDRKAHVAYARLRTPLAPSATCNRTMTKTNKLQLIAQTVRITSKIISNHNHHDRRRLLEL